MRAACLAALLAVTAPDGVAGPPASQDRSSADERPLKALSAWLRHYHNGKIRIYSTAQVYRGGHIEWSEVEITAKQSFAVKYGLAPKAGLAESTWLNDLEVIAGAVAELDTAPAAAGLVELAAVGLDRRSYARDQSPHLVRGVGEKWLSRIENDAARDEVAGIASGDVRLDRKTEVAQRGAALRGLAAFGDDKYRAAIEPQLGHGEPLLRFHAAEALGRLGDEAAARALINALEREDSDLAMPAIVEGLRSIYGAHRPGLSRASDDEPPEEPGKRLEKAPPESSRLAVRAAIKALGRASWRSDMALLRLLDDVRSKDTIPALIVILENYTDNPAQVRAGKLSTLVQHRAHELLVAMTGAVYPATEPKKWRDLWEREKDNIDVVQPRKQQAGAPTTVASGFFGIPVQGSRVIFILDLSRSMTFPMDRKTGAASTRIDYARRELNAAIDGLHENSSFNLITFDGNDKAKLWSKKLVPASARNRERLKKHVAKMRPDGGTNLWSALEDALKIKSLVYGDRYETNVDEIFILSDGAPSVGDVLDPVEILRLVKEANRFAQMRINTIFISSEDPPEERRRQMPMPWMEKIKPEELMRRLAEENGGKCVIL